MERHLEHYLDLGLGQRLDVDRYNDIPIATFFSNNVGNIPQTFRPLRLTSAAFSYLITLTCWK